MNVVIAMPWRPQPGRERAHDFTVRFYEAVFPDAEILEVDTHHEDYNLAAARNLGVQAAAERDADVVVITDADSIVAPAHHLIHAAEAAAVDGQVHMPFTDQLYLTEAETEALYRTGQHPTHERAHLGNGAIYVTTPETYERFGGSDERFSGWGGDDDQLVAAATTLAGLVRHEGVAYSLYHPANRDVGSERHRPNSALAQRYWQAMGNEPAMRRLIASRSA